MIFTIFHSADECRAAFICRVASLFQQARVILFIYNTTIYLHTHLYTPHICNSTQIQYKWTGMSLFLFWFFMLAAEKKWICSNEDFFLSAHNLTDQTTTTTVENRATTNMAAALQHKCSRSGIYVCGLYLWSMWACASFHCRLVGRTYRYR